MAISHSYVKIPVAISSMVLPLTLEANHMWLPCDKPTDVLYLFIYCFINSFIYSFIYHWFIFLFFFKANSYHIVSHLPIFFLSKEEQPRALIQRVFVTTSGFWIIGIQLKFLKIYLKIY